MMFNKGRLSKGVSATLISMLIVSSGVSVDLALAAPKHQTPTKKSATITAKSTSKTTVITKTKLASKPASQSTARGSIGKQTSSKGDGEEGENNTLDPSCKAWISAEASTGEVLDEKNSHLSLPPASMTKLMTAFVLLSAVHAGNVHWEDKVHVSARASKVGGSQVYLREGEEFPVSDLFSALMIQSANDAALALAEHIGGSKEGFVELMNESAAKLGMTESKFFSPHGLPPESDQSPDVVSANDFLILTRALVKDYPEILGVSSKMEADFRNGEFKMRNHNHLLQSFAGCDGLKTGFYNLAGFSVAATAAKNDVRVISIVMGCGNRRNRENEAARLLAEGLKKYKRVIVAKAGDIVSEKSPIADGEKLTATVAVMSDTVALVRQESITTKTDGISKEIEGCSALTAPIKAGTTCGTVKFLKDGKLLAQSPLVIKEDVEKATLSTKILRLFKLA